MTTETINGYKILYQISENKFTNTYRVQADKKKHILKCLKPEYAHDYEAIAKLHYEYTINQKLNIAGILKAESIVSGPNKESELEGILFEDFPEAMSLEQYAYAKHRLIKDINKMFLEVALQITKIVAAMHEQQIMHKNLSSRHILINPKTWEIKLSGLNLATKFYTQKEPEINPETFTGDFRFISPEQTGQIDHALDFRTDFYSLGIIFYSLVTGHLPFNMDSAVGLIYAHRAMVPIEPTDYNQQMPQILGALITKLMAKPVADRYQSIGLLLRDLQHCSAQYAKFGAIAKFPLGLESAAIFAIPDKIYGRDPEIAELAASYQNVQKGNTEIKFVTGYSGIGKTSIVNELQLKIDQSKGNFIKGKYDQYNRATPYSGIFSAFEDFFARLAQEKNRKEIFVFRKDTLDVLDQEGQVLIDVMPTLKKLLGSQPPVDTLPESVAKSRFYRLFTGLLSVLATKENPLVMFVDDLQWADAASLNLMQDLLQSGQIPYFLMLGAYRDNEIDRAHILNFAIKELEKTKLSFSQLILKPLPAAACQELIIDTLNSNQEKTNDLTSMLIKKTEGNPFFLKQLLNKLYQDSQFKYKKKAWNWDLPEIRLLDIADNVVDFMMSQLAKEEIITQSYLTDAALIGNIFDFQTLKAIQTKPTSRAVLIRTLLNAAATGYIIPLNFDIEKLTGESDEFYFKFAHDRIQQAAILLISEEERLNRSLAIARYRKELHKDQWSEKVFEIVPYYDQALPILLEIKRRDPDDLEIAIVAELNFMAACKSRLSVAYEEALLFARTAQILIHPKYWQKDFELTKDLYLQLAELEQINGEFKQAEKYFDECLKHFKKREDIVDVYTKKVKLYTSSNEHQKAITIGLKGLKMLGLKLKENPNMAKIGLNLLKVKSKLGLRKINSLLNLPEMKNEKALLAMKLMIETSTPAYQTDKNLVILIVLKMIMFSLKYGNNKDSGFAYMTYGILLSFGLNYPQGYEFGKLALDLNEKFKNIVLKPSLNEFFGSFICPWTHPLKEAIPYLKTAYQTGEEVGDVYYASLAAINIIGTSFVSSENLNAIRLEMQKNQKYIDKQKSLDLKYFFSIYQYSIAKLIKQNTKYFQIETKNHDAAQFYKLIEKLGNQNQISMYCIFELFGNYIFNNYQEALLRAKKSEKLIEYARGLFYLPEHYFYYSLTITAMYQEFSKADQAKHLKILKNNLKKFQAWNKHCSANFEAKLFLLKAELARLQGEKAQANLLYDQAIKSAKNHQFIQIEAIASECKARFYLNLENTELAQIFFLKAHSLYTQWGALAKAQQLETKYPEMFTELNAKKEEAAEKLKDKEKEISKKMQELTGLTKTNQQISEALNLEKLLKILTPAIAQTAGADRTVVILKEQKEYLAVATYQDQNIQIITPQKIKDYAELPLNLLKKVMNDKEELMLNTPTETDDKYFATHQPRSVLIMPILKESELKAIVYLENQVLRGSFQEDTISKLRILTNQASISLENALLYQDVKTLNQDLAQKIKKGVPEDDKFKAYLEELKQKAAYADVTRHIGHEIKNPMAFILGGVEMLEDETDPAKIHEYMVTLKEDIGRLLDLLDTMLEYGKPVQKKSENVDLNKMITQIHLLSRSDLGRNMIIFKLDLAPDLPEITVDKGQMRQAIINIITNAAQAIGQSGKVIIKTAQAKFKNAAKKTRKGLMIKIINTGPQITAEAKKHIFDTFYTTKDTGSGIGLSVVLNAVKTHNGMIDIESTKEETAFIIYLPLK